MDRVDQRDDVVDRRLRDDAVAEVEDVARPPAGLVEHFLRAIDSDRGYADAYTHLGDLYLRTDRFSEAVRLLEEAVSVRPDFAAGLNRLALAYGRLGLANEAVASVRKAEQLEPHNPEHPATLGLLQLDEGSLAVATSGVYDATDQSRPARPVGKLFAGHLLVDGVYVTIETTSKPLLIDAARTLAGVPKP